MYTNYKPFFKKTNKRYKRFFKTFSEKKVEVWKKELKENFLNLKLLEENVQSIKKSSSLYDNLETMYEWEWKYSQIENKLNSSPYFKRIENILKQIESRIKPVLDSITEDLLKVFNNWLENHAILSPRTWAKKRLDDFESSGGLFYEYKRYVYDSSGAVNKFLSDFLKVNLDWYDDWYDQFKNSEIDNFQYEIDSLDPEEDQEEIKEYQDRIDELEDTDINDYIDNYGIDDLIMMLGLDINNLEDQWRYEDQALNFLEKVLFPAWYKYWKSQGIDGTRKLVEKATKDLEKSKREKDFRKRILPINIALNTQHQTGSMMDYVENEFNVSKQDLDNLSNISNSTLKDWNNDIIKMKI